MSLVPDFNGLPLPEGAERRSLYHSAYRTIATYCSTLADLDKELKKILKEKGWEITADKRKNFEGEMTVKTQNRPDVHVMMNTCAKESNPPITQVKYWLDF